MLSNATISTLRAMRLNGMADVIDIGGTVSMRDRHGLKASEDGGDVL